MISACTVAVNFVNDDDWGEVCKEQQTGEWRWLDWWLQLEVTHPSLQAGGPPPVSMHPHDDDYQDQGPGDVSVATLLSTYGEYDYDNEYDLKDEVSHPTQAGGRPTVIHHEVEDEVHQLTMRARMALIINQELHQ